MTSTMETTFSSVNVMVFGFKSFSQVMSSKSSYEDLTPSFADDGTVIVQGFINSTPGVKKIIKPPYNEKTKKVLCLEKYDWFLTDNGSLWKLENNDQWTFSTSTNSENGNAIDFASNGRNLEFILYSTGAVMNFKDCSLLMLPKVKKICCGFDHHICLLENGSIYVWGNGSRGQLGNNSLNVIEKPELLDYLDGLFVIDIAVGGWHNIALTKNGTIYSWGWNNFGQLGFLCDRGRNLNDSNVSYISVLPEPNLIEWPNDQTVFSKKISCGTNHTVVLADDGTVWGCGNNSYGQINPDSSNKYFDQMTLISVSYDEICIDEISCSSWNTALFISKKSPLIL